MSQKLIDIQHHKQALQRRDKLDRILAQENALELRDKAWRFKLEIDKEEFLSWLLTQFQHE